MSLVGRLSPQFLSHISLSAIRPLFCCFLFSSLISPVYRMALWLSIPFRKVSTWEPYDHLVRVPCSWPFPVWPYPGKGTLSSIPAWKKSPSSRYTAPLCSRGRQFLSFPQYRAACILLGSSYLFLTITLLPHSCCHIYILFQRFLLTYTWFQM